MKIMVILNFNIYVSFESSAMTIYFQYIHLRPVCQLPVRVYWVHATSVHDCENYKLHVSHLFSSKLNDT